MVKHLYRFIHSLLHLLMCVLRIIEWILYNVLSVLWTFSFKHVDSLNQFVAGDNDPEKWYHWTLDKFSGGTWHYHYYKHPLHTLIGKRSRANKPKKGYYYDSINSWLSDKK